MSWNENIDEAYARFVDNITAFANIPGIFEDPEHIQRLRVRKIEVETPVELDLLVSKEGVTALGSAPPIYRTETTIMPVYHTLRVTLVPAAELTSSEEEEA